MSNILRANFQRAIIKQSASTADIAKTVLATYIKDWQQVKPLKPYFSTFENKGIIEVCRSVFYFIVFNVVYKEDPFGVQWVKSPARLLADRVGDCKSMSIFAASCLRMMGIKHLFRFVSFERGRDVTHVYVVAFDEQGREVIIDPVVRPIEFNKQPDFVYNIDIKDNRNFYLNNNQQYLAGGLRTLPISIPPTIGAILKNSKI